MILVHLLDRYGHTAPTMFSIQDESVEHLTTPLLNKLCNSAPEDTGLNDLTAKDFKVTKCSTSAHYSGEEVDILITVV